MPLFRAVIKHIEAVPAHQIIGKQDGLPTALQKGIEGFGAGELVYQSAGAVVSGD
jgi:hypothetical protein